ncbi:hypothetical protein NDU88_002020, partial [Pleurodeles waltl]
DLQAKPPSEIPIFLDNLSSNVNKTNITTFAVVNAVVSILETLSTVTKIVDTTMM